MPAKKSNPGSKKNPTGKEAHAALKKLAARYPDNAFLQTSIQLFPPDYEAGPDMSNEVLLHEALAEKYGI
jgi:hypothetical protein